MANINGKKARKQTGLNKADTKRANKHTRITAKTKKTYKKPPPYETPLTNEQKRELGKIIRLKKCVLCDNMFTGWGNNPEPVATSGVCCDDCDMNRVLPARLVDMGILS